MSAFDLGESCRCGWCGSADHGTGTCADRLAREEPLSDRALLTIAAEGEPIARRLAVELRQARADLDAHARDLAALRALVARGGEP